MKYIVVSPHIDDAFLSIGGLISDLLNRGHQVETDYIFTICNWTNPDPLYKPVLESSDVPTVTGIRKEEEARVSRIAGHRYHFYDFPDWTLRDGYSAEDSIKMVENIARRLAERAEDGAILIFPVGLQHPDHLLIREIGVSLLEAGRTIAFYEDLPYMSCGDIDFHEFCKTIKDKGFKPRSNAIDMNAKIGILHEYRTQISESWLRDIRNYSYNIPDDRYYERCWYFGDAGDPFELR